MAGDGTSRVNTEELLRAVGEITSIKKSVAANTDAAYAHFRKLQDSYAGESADDIYAVAGQLKLRFSLQKLHLQGLPRSLNITVICCSQIALYYIPNTKECPLLLLKECVRDCQWLVAVWMVFLKRLKTAKLDILWI